MKRLSIFMTLFFSVALFIGFGGDCKAKPSGDSAWIQGQGLQGFSVTGIGVCKNGNLVAGAALDPPPPYAYIFLSTDSGLTWALQDSFYVRNYPPNSFYVNTPTVTFITVDTTLLAGVWGGVFRGGIYRSTNNGISWSGIGQSWPEKDSNMTQDINCFCVAGGNIFAGDMSGVYLSTDQGTSWSADTAGLYNPDTGWPYTINGLVAIGSTIIFASTNGHGIFRSTIGSANWSRLDTISPNGWAGQGGTLATVGTKIFIAGFNGGVLVSTDNGNSWQHSDAGLNGASALLYSSGSYLFAGSSDVFVSTDTGVTWRNITIGTSVGGAGEFTVDGSYLFANGNGGVWRYPLSQLTAVKSNPVHIPSDFVLKQNYPNPFNPTTTISYQVPKAGRVTIKVFDALGREVTTLVDEFKPAGQYSVKFDASHLSSGIYFYSIRSGDYNAVKKMSLIK